MDSLEHLYQMEFPKIRNYVCRNSGNEEDAQDVFQETIMSFFSYVKQGKFNKEYDIGGFMFTVAMNNWKRKNRSQATFVELENHSHEESTPDPYESMISEEKKANILKIFSELGENCKVILTDVIFYKLSMKEIADKHEYASATTAKTRHYKCKQRLLKLVDQKPGIIEYLKTN